MKGLGKMLPAVLAGFTYPGGVFENSHRRVYTGLGALLGAGFVSEGAGRGAFLPHAGEIAHCHQRQHTGDDEHEHQRERTVPGEMIKRRTLHGTGVELALPL